MEKLVKRLAAAGVVAGVLVIGLDGGERTAAATAVVPDYAAVVAPAEIGRWTVDVSLNRTRIGPLRLTTAPARRAPASSSHPWIQHDVRITNLSERKVRLGDTRTSKYLEGPVERALLGADEGCGYGFSEGQEGIDVGVCALYLDIPTLRPGRSITRTITLYKDLDGMQPLEAGTYTFPKKVKFKVGHRQQRTRPLKAVYDIEHNP